MPKPKLIQKRFVSKITKRIEQELELKRQKQRKKVTIAISKTTNIVLFLAGTFILTLLWQSRIATPYLKAQQAYGELVFSDITLATYITRYLPFPPTGWLPIWNQGSALIGGNPLTFFYLIYPLTRLFDLLTSLQLASMVLLLFFLISSLLLFFQLSKHRALSFILTLILLLNPATYYILIAKGQITASAIIWLLPTSMLFLTLYSDRQDRRYLLFASLATGLALLINPIASIPNVFFPSLIFLISSIDFQENFSGKTKSKRSTGYLRIISKILSDTLVFSLISTALAAPGIYSFAINGFNWSVAQSCASDLCWGKYPHDLNWLSPLLLAPLLTFIPMAFLSIKKIPAGKSRLISLLLILFCFFLYLFLAQQKAINSIVGQLPPQQLFWAISSLSLAAVACSRALLWLYLPKRSTVAFSLCIVLFAVLIPAYPDSIHFNAQQIMAGSRSLPLDVDQAIIDKYRSAPLSQILPQWLNQDHSNWRLESFRPDFFIWWNIVSETPLTQGYSLLPSVKQQNWQYFLHTSLLAPKLPSELELPPNMRLNRSRFLIDSYAIKYLHASSETVLEDYAEYDPELLGSQDFLLKEETIGNSIFFEINDSSTTPVIYPTNAQRLLIVADDQGYETFLRALSFIGINSKTLIPIKGPESINDLTDEQLQISDAVVLYQFSGNHWKKLTDAVQNGKNLFIDIGSLEQLPSEIPELFGTETLIMHYENNWNLIDYSSPLVENVNVRNFAPLRFGEDPWRMNTAPSVESLSSWMQPILTQNQLPILTLGKTANSTVIFSGFNLPYHILSFHNQEETNLLANVINALAPPPVGTPKFAVERPQPNTFNVSAQRAKGVYFKENFHPGWKALVNKNKAPIYQAGLGFMYVPIPAAASSATSQIKLMFTGSTLTWLLPLTGLSTLILSLLYLLYPHPFFQVQIFYNRKFIRPLRRWWLKDEY